MDNLEHEPKPKKKRRRLLFRLELIVVVAFVLATAARLFVVQPFVVSGDSMEPAYRPGDYLIINRLSYRFKPLQRGNVIIFRYPLDPSMFFIKRVDALPGQQVNEVTGKLGSSTPPDQQTNVMATSSRVITLANDEYFVLGDNRKVSSDSRTWGPLQKKFIVGRVMFRVWPL